MKCICQIGKYSAEVLHNCTCCTMIDLSSAINMFLNEGEVRPSCAGAVVALLYPDPPPSAVAARVQEVLEASPFSVWDTMAAAASSEIVSLGSIGAYDAHGVTAEELRCFATLQAATSRLIHLKHYAVP